MATSNLRYFLCFFCCLAFISIHATILHVPATYSTIQSAIDQADTGDTVLVAPGIYPERLKFRGKDIVLASHFLTTGDPAFIEQTIIDAEQLGTAILLEEGETEATVITGFTILRGSKETESLMPEFAGGIVCLGASPQIRHNHIRNAFAVTLVYFGGIVCSNSEALIEYNQIDSIFGAFVQKTGGIVCHQSSTTIQHNRIENVTGGYVFQVGGGIVADSSAVVIQYNLIDSSDFDSGVKQGGIALVKSEASIINNTVVRHNQGIRLEQGSQANMINNILYYNGGFWDDFTNISIADSTNDLSATYNNIEGGWPEFPNFNIAPMFVDQRGDFHLQAGSPCIDRGDPYSNNDPDGTRADIGAFYFDQLTSVRPTEDIPKLQLFPNPATTVVYVKNEWQKVDSLEIYDVWGRLQAKTAPNPYGDTIIDIDQLPAGTYLVQLKGKKGLIAQSKMVVN